MADYTEVLELTKPLDSEFYDIDVFNGNADKIDAAFSELQGENESLGAQVSALQAAHESDLAELEERVDEVQGVAELALPSANYTASDILTKLKTVDGTGSGLDADLFKGKSTIPVANGGTGATTAADARSNLGAVSKTGDTITGDLKVTGKLAVQHSNSGRSGEVWSAGGTGLALSFLDAATEGGGKRTLKINGISGAENPNVDNAIQFVQTLDGTSEYYTVFTSANAASRIQSLLTGGSISVVKSVQRGTVAAGKTDSGTITITAVNMNKAFVNLAGTNNGQGGPVQLKLSSATSIAWERSYIYGAGTNSDKSGFSWEIVEYY